MIRKGYGWVKYLLLIFILLRINSLVGKGVDGIMFNILETVVDLIVTAIEVWITILLFRVNTESVST